MVVLAPLPVVVPVVVCAPLGVVACAYVCMVVSTMRGAVLVLLWRSWWRVRPSALRRGVCLRLPACAAPGRLVDLPTHARARGRLEHYHKLRGRSLICPDL